MTKQNAEAILAFDHVSHSFAGPGRSEDPGKCVLQDITIEIRAPEIVCIIGPSGCGKTTLLNLAAGLIAPTSGTVYAHGQPVTRPHVSRAMMFQEDTLFPWLTVRGNIAFGPQCQHDRERLLEVSRIIELVGLSGYEDYRPAQLSGGMKQRVALARALINHADILLLDEPFASLDAQTRETMQELMLEIHERIKPCILLVTHDIEEAVFLGERVIVLYPQGAGSRVGETVNTGLRRPRTAEMREEPRLAALRAHLRDVLRGTNSNKGGDSDQSRS
jgi:NitT/TauT family transport system ATP-binding protein